MAHNKRYSMLNRHFEDKGSSINRTEPDAPVIGHKLDVKALVKQKNAEYTREQSTPPQEGTQPPGAATS